MINFSNESVPPLFDLLTLLGLAETTGEALRHLKSAAVRLNGETVKDPELVVTATGKHTLQIGKRRHAVFTVWRA